MGQMKNEGPLVRPLVIPSPVIGHDGKSCVAIVDTEADTLTGFESGCGEPVVGDLHPRKIRLSVGLDRTGIRDAAPDAAAMFFPGLPGFAGFAWFCLRWCLLAATGEVPETDPVG
jgi:hypothetical protein